MNTVIEVILALNLVYGCLSMQPTAGSAPSMGSNPNPSLLLSFLMPNGVSSPSGLPMGSSTPQGTSTGGSTAPVTSTSQSQNQASNSNPQTTGTQAAAPSTNPSLLTPNMLNQRILQDLAMLRPNAPKPFDIAPVRSTAANQTPRTSMRRQFQEYLMMLSADALGCVSIGEVIGGESMAYFPVPCNGMCRRGTTCKTIGKVGFCCPRRVSNNQITLNLLRGGIEL